MSTIPDRSRDHRRNVMVLRTAVVVGVAALLLSSCDWSAYRFGPDRTGYNPLETQVSVSNVSSLHQRFQAPIGGGSYGYLEGSPVVANHVAYVGSNTTYHAGVLYAFDASGTTNCSGAPNTCAPLWSAPMTDLLQTTPLVANGVVYVVAGNGVLSAFDANGVTNCSGSPKTCTPLWTANTGGSFLFLTSSPIVVSGVLYVGSANGKLYAFDANGVTGCSGAPKTCAPLWTASTGDRIISASPAVVNGKVYVTAFLLSNGGETVDGLLYAFDAAGGPSHCFGSPKTCTALFIGDRGNHPSGGFSTPVVYQGTVYISDWNDGYVFGYDANGVTSCSPVQGNATLNTCSPTFIGYAGDGYDHISSSPAAANGKLYVRSENGNLYVFDATKQTNCFSVLCNPLFTAANNIGGDRYSSPTIANGVVYSGSQAFDANGISGCSGVPKTCSPLWTAPFDPQYTEGSTTVLDGSVYLLSDDIHGNSTLRAFSL